MDGKKNELLAEGAPLLVKKTLGFVRTTTLGEF